MTVANKLTIAVLVAAFGGLIVPAFAQNGLSDMQSRHDHGMSMGHMGRGMMGGGMMSGCADMMESMNNGGDGRPNSQWQKHPPQTQDNGG
jgi:hypothetical protein